MTLFINCFPLSMVTVIWDVIICEGLPVVLAIAVSILQVLKDSLLSMHFEEIVKFFKMMKTYDDEDGELNAFRIGQLLMNHTEHVEIPEHIFEFLHRRDVDLSTDAAEQWEESSNSWFQSLSRILAPPWPSSTRRRAGSHRMVADASVDRGLRVATGATGAPGATAAPGAFAGASPAPQTAGPFRGARSQPAGATDAQGDQEDQELVRQWTIL